MKHNWTYKKLGDILSYINDGDWIESKDQAENGIRLIQTGNIGVGEYKDKGDKAKYISEATFLELQCTEIFPGDCLISRLPDPIGRACLLPQFEGRAITAVDCSILRFKDIVLPKYFIFYAMTSAYFGHINKYSTGATRKRISRKNLMSIPIPVPSLDEQKAIVRELDGINHLIDLQEEQLREYDRLAQSLFYTTFGDPVSNPKGWEVKKLGEISTLLNGRAYSKNELLNKGKYRILRVGNFFTNDSWYYSDLELDADKYCDKGDLLFAWSASFCARIWEGEKVIYHYHIWKVLCDETQLDKMFYCHLLNNMLESMKKDTHGTGMVHLTKIGMEQYYLPLPPLSLQQSFAAQIEAIEQQKALIRRSLDETRTLLAARMQYYFE